MLNHCAPGSRWDEQLHHYWVYYKRAEPYKDLPIGDRSARDPEIQRRHIISMVTFLGIDKDCVEKMIPQIRFKAKDAENQ
jgi:hypothetical protein